MSALRPSAIVLKVFGGGNLLTHIVELAQAIKENGLRSRQELPALLTEAHQLAQDTRLDVLSRALAHRAAGNAHQLLNEFDAADLSYDNAIGLLEKIDDPLELGRTLHAKVGVLHFLCRFGDLLVCASRARELFTDLGDSHRIARLDVNLSHAYHRLDRFDMVLECAERAIPVLEEMKDHEAHLAALMNSAVALTLRHEFEEADRRYRRALPVAEEKGLHVWAMHCRYNIAFLEYLRGHTSASLKEIATLRVEYQQMGDRSQLCKCWLSEAEILLEIGDLEMAFEAAQRAASLATDLGLSLERGKSLLTQAAVCIRQHHTAEAVPLLAEASRCFEAEGNSVWSAIAQLQTSLLRGESGVPEALDEAVGARARLAGTGLYQHLALADIVIGRLKRARRNYDQAIESFQSALSLAEHGRSEWMQFHALQELATSLIDRAPATAHAHLVKAEAMLDSLWHRLGSDDLKLAFLNDRENLYTLLVRLTAEDSASTAFRFSEKAHSRVLTERLTHRIPNLGSIQQRLTRGETLVEYFVDNEDLVIFAVSADDLKCVRKPSAVPEIQSHQVGLERHISSCSVKWEHLATASGHLSRTIKAHLGALHRLLIEPIADALREHVVIIPHSFLHGIPFHALWDGDRYLLEDHQIAYSPSAGLYCTPPERQNSKSSVFVAFSLPDNTTAVEEVEEASALFRGSTVLINPSIGELTGAMAQPHALVHIAGHVSVDPIGGKLSWIEMPEGKLTGRDLTGMSISTRTLVITGCSTARRTIRSGDEWQGLMRDFYMSGADSIVSAFWNIRDRSARRFASEFYRHFPADSADMAVRKTALTLCNEERHPYFWAGFGAFIRKTD